MSNLTFSLPLKNALLFLLGLVVGIVLTAVFAMARSGKTLTSFRHTLHAVPSGVPGLVRVILRDAKGNPMANRYVSVEDSSATTGGQTGDNGQVEFKLVETDIVNICLDRRIILESNILKGFSSEQGLEVQYVLE